MTEEISAPAPRKKVFTVKNIVGFTLLLALAAVFLFSGLTKIGLGIIEKNDHFQGFYWTYAGVEAFTFNFIDLGIDSLLWAGVLARVMVGLEFMIAAFLLAHIFLRSVTYPLTIGLLVIFIIHLSIQIALFGNDGNCGCFGDQLEMKPFAAIIKNVIMIAVAALLYYIYPVKPYKRQEWISVLIAMATLVTPFIIDPLAGTTPKVVHEKIDLNALYEKENVPQVELREGKHIVAFMSLTCPHCRIAAKRFAIINKNNPDLPIYFVLAGSPDNMVPFFKETGSEKVPHILFRDPENFLKMAGNGVPAIYFINNSVVVRDANYFQLDPQYMKEWVGK